MILELGQFVQKDTYLKQHKKVQTHNLKIVIINLIITTVVVILNIYIRAEKQIVVKIEDQARYLSVVNTYGDYIKIISYISVIALIVCIIVSVYMLMSYNKALADRHNTLVGYFEQVGLSKIDVHDPILTDYDLQVIDSWNESVKKIDCLNELREKYFKNMVHDLKTPIQILKMNIRMLSIDLPDNEYAEAIKEELEILEKSVTNYLILEKITFFEKVNLQSLEFDKYFNHIKERYNNMDFEINTFEINNTKLILTDETMFTRIVENLIENAIKYSSEKSIDIYLENETLIFVNKVDSKENIGNIFTGARKYSRMGNGLGVEIINTYIKQLNWSISSSHEKNEFQVFITFKNKVVDE